MLNTLQNMRIFVRVVESGGFTAAAQHLNITTAYASRAVANLEAHLQTRLLHRTTRRTALTEAGERYFRHCNEILAYVEEAEAEAGRAHATPQGNLRVHSMTSFGQHYAVPMVGRYQARHPSVNVELTLTQRMPNLIEEGYDAAIVLATDLPDSDVVSQRLGSVFSIACASPAYLSRKGTPTSLKSLTRHTCLQLVTPGFPPDKWVLDGPEGQETLSLGPSTFIVNVAEAMSAAVQEGMGVGVLPVSSALPGLRSGALIRVLPQYTMLTLQVYAIYQSRQYLDAKIRTWIQLLKEELPSVLESDADAVHALPTGYAD